ncbi:HesA/MoeB/ThiF family protein [Sporomusa acidovorans]|uniref:THIF-type NAD/FAD binding fold domain-containing protein n=1 Tax=Sporomusa acidovorans (strain ATCC 49682 / DSM 3132 / Mol) TaxID=1123286 RepID=A0ABZ3IX43_SPOA4|nr:HesA/MoeB/ThiF family protein [Sporomusa acidovorans]OZC23346.1 molybdopterin-synthase adenylyltransferase [Sporomusa acidovorans DSM 3132]SDE42563.1 Molybdopterin or thiamine biosynthesis adenylyltransferase [Sporomusa acidovorans]
MILEREQINRYLRHILIPEISGPGQKKLLESSVFICGETVNDSAAAVYYLAASGIGHICCHFDEPAGFEGLAAEIHDLNDDVSIECSDGSRSDLRIFLGRPEFISNKQDLICCSRVPSVLAFYRGWKGGMQVAGDGGGLHFLLTKLSDTLAEWELASLANATNGEIFSNCVLSALGVMEAIKLLLGIGTVIPDFLYFSLLSMEFAKVGDAELAHKLPELCSLSPEECPEVNLTDRKVLIVGTGGLGSPAAYALALAGVGTIGLVDYDTVEISNLNRQILHSGSRIGMPKVASAALFLKRLNPAIAINCYHTGLNKENVFDTIAGYDVVIDAVDNFPTRFLINDACFFAGKPFIDAGVIRFDGTFRTVLPQQGPCYRCTLPDIPVDGSIPSCAESGVLGPIPGIMGFIQSAEAVKLLTGEGHILSDKMIFFDGLFSEFCTVKLSRNSACPLCGTDPAIRELQEYEFICPDKADETNCP